MMRHYSVGKLSSYRAGLLSSRQRARISAHLSGCTRCSGTIAEVGQVSVVLSSLPRPSAPELVVTRIEMVIARESAARTATAEAGGATASSQSAQMPEPVSIPGRPDLPERSRSRSRRLRMPELTGQLVLRTVAATGALVIIAGAFLFASNRLESSSSGPSSSSKGTAAHGPAASSNQPSFSSSGTHPLSYHVGRKLATTVAMTSKVNLTKQSLPGQVRAAARSHPAFSTINGGATSGSFTPAATPTTSGAPTTSATPTSSSGVPSASPAHLGVFTVLRLEACLTRIAAGHSVLITEVAHYLGRPAAIIVLSPVTSSNVFHVFVVGLRCSASVSDVIARTVVPRRG